MNKRYLITAALAAVLILLPCCAAFAQEQTPPQPTEGEVTQTPGGIYLYKDGELTLVTRDITGGNQMVEFALIELFKGPTEEEKAAGYETFIPEGVKLQYTTVKQDRSEFSVNLSRELLDLSGDEDASAKALTQIVRTAQEVSGIQNIGITVAGEAMGDQPQDAFDALGVDKSETGTEGSTPEEQSEGGGGLLWLWILLGVGGAVTLGVIAFFVARGRKPAPGGKPATRTSSGKKPKR
ncbi:MAG: GerMN domain-containing protein [Actinomycetota bacterium]